MLKPIFAHIYCHFRSNHKLQPVYMFDICFPFSPLQTQTLLFYFTKSATLSLVNNNCARNSTLLEHAGIKL